METLVEPLDKKPSSIFPGAQNLTFTLFPKLPTEVRMMIWKLSLPEPKIVEIQSITQDHSGSEIFLHDKRSSSQDRFCNYPHEWAPRSLENVPALLAVCSESRAEVLHSYRAIKGTLTDRITYMDMERDTLSFDRGNCVFMACFTARVDPELLRAIRFLALNYQYFYLYGMVNIPNLLKFTGLKELLIWDSSFHGGAIIDFPKRYQCDVTATGLKRRPFNEPYFFRDIDLVKREHPEWKDVEILVSKKAFMRCRNEGYGKCYCCDHMLAHETTDHLVDAFEWVARIRALCQRV